jgi:hypothetical protein
MSKNLTKNGIWKMTFQNKTITTTEIENIIKTLKHKPPTPTNPQPPTPSRNGPISHT